MQKKAARDIRGGRYYLFGLNQLQGFRHDIIYGETEQLKQFTRGRRLAKAIDTNYVAFEANVLAPEVADTGFNRQAHDAARQN